MTMKDDFTSRAGANNVEEPADENRCIPSDEQVPSEQGTDQNELRWCTTRRNITIGLVGILTTIAVLIPTVFLKDDAAAWKRSFYLFENHDRTNEYNIESAGFGEAVAISADGSRLVFRGLDALEVWDWDKHEEWMFKYRFEGDFGNDDHPIQLNHAGTRIAVVQRVPWLNLSIAPNVAFNTLVVYDDVSDGKGTEWAQLGETLHGLYYLNLTDPDLRLDFSDEWAQYETYVAALHFAETFSLSGDGTTICSGAHSSTTLSTNTTSFAMSVGEVQIFRHIDTFALPPSTFPNVTWVPTGNIRGSREGEHLGAKVVLSANGTVLVVTRDISWSFPIASFYKYKENEWMQTWDVGISEPTNKLYFDGVWRPSRLAISDDTLTWAVGTPGYDLPNKAQAGRVQVFHFRPELGFGASIYRNQTADLFGGAKGEYFGMTLSISPGGDFLAVGSNDGIQTFREDQEGKWTRYGNTFGKPTQQRECCFDKFSFGETVAISADGEHVVGGAPRRRNKFEGTMSTGDVGVWDYKTSSSPAPSDGYAK